MTQSIKPLISDWTNQWKKNFERRVFDFSSEKDQEDFNLAVKELVKHIVHTSKKASIATVITDDHIRTAYISVSDF